MKKIIIGYLDDENYDIQNTIVKDIAKKHTNLTIIKEKDIFNLCENILTNLRENINNIAIVIDDFSILPFIILAKHKNTTAAQICDEYSARMTKLHNNANILILGYKVLTPLKIISIIETYIQSSYEAGRHEIRLNMLRKLEELGGLK